MKLWPADLLARYPLPPGDGSDWPLRPWWGPGPCRRDDKAAIISAMTPLKGMFMTQVFQGYFEGRPTGEPAPTVAGVMALLDAAHPVAHPGYRAGQVWGADDGSAVSLGRVDGVEGHEQFVIAGGHAYTRWTCKDLREHGYIYLVADPCCPWLAPWAPAEAA